MAEKENLFKLVPRYNQTNSELNSYLTKITKCLRDPCELVRRHTFILLSRLLQRDYVKWRGVLFLRFLLSLVDESEKIRQLADYLFGNILKVKAPLLAYNSFVEAIYVLNDCRAHSGHSDSKASRAESRLFSIRGNDERSRSRRMHIYVSLLKQMAPEHLLATFAKLCAEVLVAASDGMLNIDDATARSVLQNLISFPWLKAQDTFDILACKEIRLSINRVSSSESGDVDEEGGESGGASAARGKVITHAVRKSLIQNTIPIFIELKRLMESKNSPLIGSLMECLRVLLKDYKNEIDDLLVADKQLQKELLYDIQKYESTKAKSAVAEAVNEMHKSTNYLSPEAPPQAGSIINNLTSKLQNDSKVASAIADAAAAATAKSVLREVNRGTSTPPLGSLSLPKLKSRTGGNNGTNTSRLNVIESLRKHQNHGGLKGRSSTIVSASGSSG
uniref:Condensin complex subunit 1 C-terminal domain-containing protein n=1 Tax=Cucumis melo TaxID=3656 RepID=A0A9I9EKV7_CUCME